MKLGIDFGTTRIVVVRADRGNYPIHTFESAEGEAREWWPALIAARGRELRFGWDAWSMASEPDWTVVRSIKRLLESAGPATEVEIAGERFGLLDLLTGMARALKNAINANEPLEVMVGVPANANSNQRYLTAEAFRRAGFHVSGLLNEPSAAGVEYGHAKREGKAAEELLLVYDLGGGTFDASLVRLQDGEHEVLATESISTLGGDDFDMAMAELAVSEDQFHTLHQSAVFTLLEQCRVAKESLNPNSRRVTLDLDLVHPEWPAKQVAVSDYYERCRPLLEETLGAVDDLLSAEAPDGIDCLYVTGGASELPLVPRMLRERFGRRVKRSAYTRAATAIGLAIHADGQAGFRLREKFSRYFGVWREGDGGSLILFDPVFSKGDALPRPKEDPLKHQRKYSPAHNIGHFRFLEATSIDSAGRPGGDIVLWDEILFPFEPELAENPELGTVPVVHSQVSPSQEISETWTCDANGGVEVEIANRTAGYSRKYQLARWKSAAAVAPARPSRRKARA